jgi:hypothetical protein
VPILFTSLLLRRHLFLRQYLQKLLPLRFVLTSRLLASRLIETLIPERLHVERRPFGGCGPDTSLYSFCFQRI